MVVRYVLKVRGLPKRLGRLRLLCAALILAAAANVLLYAGNGTKGAGHSTLLKMPPTEDAWNPPGNALREFKTEPDVIKILIVVCQSKNDSDELFSLTRQLLQTDTLLKSAVYLTTMNICFYVVCGSPEIYDQVLALTNTWPSHMLSKVTFKYLATWFPSNMQHVREVFRPCSTQRLFIEHLLPTEDAVIYMDTDIIFLRSPDQLWREFQAFNSTQMVSAAMPTLIRRDDPHMSEVIDFSSVGFNAGLLLVNLTRLRSFPGGYQNAVTRALKDYGDILLSDQDIMNYIFNKMPQYFRELLCPWNFRWPLCEDVRQRCAELLTLGAYAVHGIGGAFLSEYHPKIREFHTLWSRLNLSEPLHEFVRTLEARLMKRKSGVSYCSHFKYLKQILLQQLKSRLMQDKLGYEPYG